MTTNEGVIVSALNERREFDIFHVVKPSRQFVATTSLQSEYFRVYLSSLDGYHPYRHRTAHCATDAVPPLPSSAVRSLHTVYVECTLYHLNQPVGCPLSSSHSYTNEFLIQEWIEFPVRLSELPLDSQVLCVVHSVDGIVGAMSFFPFTSRGELKTGSRRYPLMPTVEQAMNREDGTIKQQYEVWELAARDKAHGRLAPVPWLDTITTAKLHELSESRRKSSSASTSKGYHSHHPSLTTSSSPPYPVLSIEFPTTSNSLPVFHMSIPRDHDVDAWAYDVPPSAIRPVFDLDHGMENISELKASLLSRSLFLISDPEAQPSFKERKQITAIIHRPLIQLDVMKVDDAALLWKFRQFLTKDPNAYLPFMTCVDWANRGERTEAERLMPLWKAVSLESALVCLSYLFEGTRSIRVFAIDRLSKESPSKLHTFALQLVQGVRYDSQSELFDFMVSCSMRDWEFCCHAFWFLCVEVELEGGGKRSSAAANNTKSFSAALDRFLNILKTASPHFHRRLHEQEALKKALGTMHTMIHKDHKERTKKVEAAKEILRRQTCGLREVFLEAPPEEPKSSISTPAPLAAVLATVASAASGVAGGSGADGGGSGSLEGWKPKAITLPSHPHVSVHGVTDDGFVMFKSAKMPMLMNFLQGKAPGVHHGRTYSDTDFADRDNALTVRVLPDGLQTDGGAGTARATTESEQANAAASASSSKSASSSPQKAKPYFPIIFKCGDDVRQDQLVIQIIELMDKLLKDNGLDLCLTPYRVLATSPNDGFMEVVPQVVTFQSVQRDVVKYIASHNKTTEKMASAMERFVKSCAGYCVITFILGIGDRHLENLLITEDGRLLHIDFGFIFGNDPKPFPPPMKICKEMVDAMGGPQSAQYSQFKTYCCSAYNILRKHYSVIMAILLLMVDGSIPQISCGSRRSAQALPSVPQLDPRLELLKVQDKFRLDLNNAEATQYIQNVIADSVGAIFTNLWDVIHVAAQAARN